MTKLYKFIERQNCVFGTFAPPFVVSIGIENRGTGSFPFPIRQKTIKFRKFSLKKHRRIVLNRNYREQGVKSTKKATSKLFKRRYGAVNTVFHLHTWMTYCESLLISLL